MKSNKTKMPGKGPSMLKDNYKIYTLLRDGLAEIPVYKENYELFQTINYLSVKK